MSERWVMTERKLLTVKKKHTRERGLDFVENVQKIFAVGDDAPPEHWHRPYTRRVDDDPPAVRVDMGQRIEDPAPNRMLDTKGATKRKRGNREA